MNLDWQNRDICRGKTVITTIDAHAAGEPLRIVTGGLPEIPGETMLERRRFAQNHLEQFRRALMHEPRGHREMYGAIVTPPASPEADLGVLFMHNEGYSTMCGHGIIALVTALIETGAWPESRPDTRLTIDTPAGSIVATARVGEQRIVECVSFINVPSFVSYQNIKLDIPGLPPLLVDIAFGGAFYAVLPVAQLCLRVSLADLSKLVNIAAQIKEAVSCAVSIDHAQHRDLGFLYGVIFTDSPEDPKNHSRNLCVFANAEVDRSPTGTGLSARLALHHARGEINNGQTITIEGILGSDSTFQGRVIQQIEIGDIDGVIPEISGRAHIISQTTHLVDDFDKLGQGFLI